MRPAISLDRETGTSRFQADDDINEDLSHDISYREALGCVRNDYECMSVPEQKVVPMAEVSWADAMTTADRLKHISDLALMMELNRRGHKSASKILETQI
jgi:hypothetical protein